MLPASRQLKSRVFAARKHACQGTAEITSAIRRPTTHVQKIEIRFRKIDPKKLTTPREQSGHKSPDTICVAAPLQTAFLGRDGVASVFDRPKNSADSWQSDRYLRRQNIFQTCYKSSNIWRRKARSVRIPSSAATSYIASHSLRGHV